MIAKALGDLASDAALAVLAVAIGSALAATGAILAVRWWRRRR